jgi:hypothetical protein
VKKTTLRIDRAVTVDDDDIDDDVDDDNNDEIEIFISKRSMYPKLFLRTTERQRERERERQRQRQSSGSDNVVDDL